MPIAARCPSCSCPLSETSILALAPVCQACGIVITEVGGSLGQTSTYGVNDPTIQRARVAADLSVLLAYSSKYAGMIESCKEQLLWGVERYAQLPQKPNLLPLQPVPSLLSCLFYGLSLATICSAYACFVPLLSAIVFFITLLGVAIDSKLLRDQAFVRNFLSSGFITVSWWGGFTLFYLWPYFSAIQANGERPMENARRQKDYELAYAMALKAAEPVRSAQNHRLSVQIRELEGLVRTVTKKADDVRRILASL